METDLDVAIVGGGPAGSTLGTLLKKYAPQIKVGIFEREVFPRDHIGESLLPAVSVVLNEMDAWDKVEAANFPIKIGAAFRWGRRPERWNFDFYPSEQFVDEPRPAKYHGQRMATAFQVDRSIYDKILLDHAASMGCDVHQGVKVSKVNVNGERVAGLELANGETINARYYVNASGNSGLIRRALGVECEFPDTLRNIAIYDYWQNADWAVEIGVGGTRIQVLSLGYGWIWFIPLGPTRTSIGLVIPVEYYKSSGKTPAELYAQALKDEAIVQNLIRNADCENKLETTRDWSFTAKRQAGENWFLVGEAAGFADPILSAGVSMAHFGAMQLACTILEIDRGKLDPNWLRQEFEHRQIQRIRIHIRFGDYWYTANEQFKELKDHTTNIAKEIGRDMTPEGAWDWMARGGFIDEDLLVGVGGFSLGVLRDIGDKLDIRESSSPFTKYNKFMLDLAGAELKDRAEYHRGTVIRTQSYSRDGRILPLVGHIAFVVDLLKKSPYIGQIIGMAQAAIAQQVPDEIARRRALIPVVEALEGLINDGWVKSSFDPQRGVFRFENVVNATKWEAQDTATFG